MKPEIIKYISAKERSHYMKRTDCGDYFDMRDVQQVFDHFHKSAAMNAGYSESISENYTKGKP